MRCFKQIYFLLPFYQHCFPKNKEENPLKINFKNTNLRLEKNKFQLGSNKFICEKYLYETKEPTTETAVINFISFAQYIRSVELKNSIFVILARHCKQEFKKIL